jgi:ribosome-binding protein aMBF1 (putative translation factor)
MQQTNQQTNKGVGQGKRPKGQHKRNYQKQAIDPHVFLHNPNLHHRYNELLKEARMWNGMGQYELGTQSNILAQQILSGNTDAADIILKSETYFIQTKKSPIYHRI